jgi:hypothetical protein
MMNSEVANFMVETTKSLDLWRERTKTNNAPLWEKSRAGKGLFQSSTYPKDSSTKELAVCSSRMNRRRKTTTAQQDTSSTEVTTEGHPVDVMNGRKQE